MLKVVTVLVTLLARMPGSAGGLLGAGEGEGSCAAAPFRAHHVQWSYGCPAFAPCCSEFGFCRPLAEWQYGEFRDRNGVSNGTPLSHQVLEAEQAAGGYHGQPAGEVGPHPDNIKAHYAAPPPPPPPHHHAVSPLIHGPPPPPTPP